MNKPFLLIANEGYYPGDGTSDWIGCFETREEAEAQITITNGSNEDFDLAFRAKDRSIRSGRYEIVDLREWVG